MMIAVPFKRNSPEERVDGHEIQSTEGTPPFHYSFSKLLDSSSNISNSLHDPKKDCEKHKECSMIPGHSDSERSKTVGAHIGQQTEQLQI